MTGHSNGHDIKSDFNIGSIVPAQIILGSKFEMSLFRGVDCCLRGAEKLTAAELYFNENQGITVPGNEINFAIRGSIVSGHNCVTLLLQRVCGQGFSCLTK